MGVWPGNRPCYSDTMEALPRKTEMIPLTGSVVGKALALFWGAFVALNTVRAALLGYPDFLGALERRLFVGLVGAALSWAMYRILLRLQPSSLRTGIAWTAAMSLPAALVFSTVNFLAFNLLTPLPGDTCNGGQRCTMRDLLVSVSDMQINWTFVFIAWGLLYLSLASAAQTRASDLRSAADREAARLAQIRALRYQVNPHFLFNVLNSLTALVSRRETSEAEDMIGEIGHFFRSSLANDPTADTMLIDEVEMQRRYLELERRRFPARLLVRIEIAPEVASASVPPLILQPLIENAVKHGVGRTSSAVTITIRASHALDGALRILVEDDAPAPTGASGELTPTEKPDGLGVGLRNVAERLSARFGAAARFTAAVLPSGGFRAELVMPLVRG